MNARYYDSEIGRFITQDTYRGEKNDAGTWHLYAYCANDPINYVDPSGHSRIKNALKSGVSKVKNTIKKINFFIPSWIISGGVEAALVIFPVMKTIKKGMKSVAIAFSCMGYSTRKKLVKKICYKVAELTAKILILSETKVYNAILAFTGFSIGGLIADMIDPMDGKKDKGYRVKFN